VLNDIEPEAVFIAEGSSVGIEWKRNRLNDERRKTNLPTKICGMQQTFHLAKKWKRFGMR
jgi:hypothetical protein